MICHFWASMLGVSLGYGWGMLGQGVEAVSFLAGKWRVYPSNLLSHFRANDNLLHKKITLVRAQTIFFCVKSCTFEKFVVILHTKYKFNIKNNVKSI